MNEILTIIVSAAVGAVVSYLASYWERRARVDEGLRDKRIELYSLLWQATGKVPMWPKRDDLTYTELRELSSAFRGWYFDDKGGMFLSSAARKAYEGVQVAITAQLAARAQARLSDAEVISDPDYTAVQQAGSALRTQLTKDLLSRRAASRLM